MLDEDTAKDIGLSNNSNHVSTDTAPLLLLLLNYSSVRAEEISALYESEQFAIF